MRTSPFNNQDIVAPTTPEMRTLLLIKTLYVIPKVSRIEGFHCKLHVHCNDNVALTPGTPSQLFNVACRQHPTSPAFLHATLKSWERGPGDEAMVIEYAHAYESCTCTKNSIKPRPQAHSSVERCTHPEYFKMQFVHHIIVPY